MSSNKKILIIGEIFVDTHLDQKEVLVRLGGIFHSARAFSAIDTSYSLAYYAPSYLENDINDYAKNTLNATECTKLGNVDQCPNVMLISDSTEFSFQGYHNILSAQAQFNTTINIDEVIKKNNPTDILIYPGRYNIHPILDTISKSYSNLKVHIDMHYDGNSLCEYVKNQCFLIHTLFLSTSSEFFKTLAEDNTQLTSNIANCFNLQYLVMKENRGGSYCYDYKTKYTHDAESYPTITMHSVGVGDVYNAIYISSYEDNNIPENIKLASYIASKYTETFCFTKFKQNVSLVLGNKDMYMSLQGIRIPWDMRKLKKIYIAAPDFPDIDTSLLDQLEEALLYHNFSPKRPIKENGLAQQDMTEAEEFSLYYKDCSLLKDCCLLIAVLLNNDPGTLVELGRFKEMGKPTIIFDPYRICTNLFVKHTPNILCYTLNDVIEETYNLLNKRNN